MKIIPSLPLQGKASTSLVAKPPPKPQGGLPLEDLFQPGERVALSSPSGKSEPSTSTRTTDHTPEKINAAGPLLIEDSHPRTYFESFRTPAELSHLPAHFQTNWSSRTGIPPWKFLQQLFADSPVSAESGTLSLEVCSGKPNWLEYNFQLTDPESRARVGKMNREIVFDEKNGHQVYHHYFSLSESCQGAGVAKTLLANSVRLYDQIGVKSVHVVAGLDVGGYAWAKYGFKPDPGEETRYLFDLVRQRLGELDLPEAVKRTVGRLLEDDNPKAIWALSDLDGIKLKDGRTLGKALLLGSDWAGKLDLTCSDSRARFDQYINKGSRSGSPKGA